LPVSSSKYRKVGSNRLQMEHIGHASYAREYLRCFRNGREWFCKCRHNDDREEIWTEIVGNRFDSGRI